MYYGQMVDQAYYTIGTLYVIITIYLLSDYFRCSRRSAINENELWGSLVVTYNTLCDGTYRLHF